MVDMAGWKSPGVVNLTGAFPLMSLAGIVNLTICDRVGGGCWSDHAATEAHVHASNELARRSL